MKITSKFKKYSNKIFLFLKKPNNWHLTFSNKKTYILFVVGIMLFLLAGVRLNIEWKFPHFYGFMLCFLFIGCLSFCATNHYSIRIKAISSKIAGQPAAIKANSFYHRYANDSIIYILIPLLIICVFGIGGCKMFGAIQFTPTLIWILVLFFVVVYISIIGYLQYIVLAIDVRNLANSSGVYKQLQKSAADCIPAQLEWVQELTRLTHTYRSDFFTLGSAYILAFGAFCWLPEMQANTSSHTFYFLWGVIFIMIVVLFPVISILEHKWIKQIVSHLKSCYINDLAKEKKLKNKSGIVDEEFKIYKPLIHTICAIQILNSKDYPLSSKWANGYAAVLSVVNFIAAIVTMFQGMPMISDVLVQIL